MAQTFGLATRSRMPLNIGGLKTGNISTHFRSRRLYSTSNQTTAVSATATAASHRSNVDLPEEAVEAANAASTFSSQLLGASSDAFLALPQALGGVSYATSIVLLTVALRCTVTLPMIVWQRKRIRRVQELVVPAAKAWLADARYALRAEYRRAGKGYEQYVTALNLMAKQQFKKLAAQYKCRPLPTMLIPPLVHIPIFIGTTLTIREACNRSFSSLQSSASVLESGHGGLSPDSQLATLALESIAWCPSLTDVDPYSALPLAVGITALLNVETQAKIRQKMAELRDAASASEEDPQINANQTATPLSRKGAGRPQSSTSRPAAVLPKILQPKTLSTTANLSSRPSDVRVPPASTAVKATTSTTASAARSRAITNVLRFASIMFIPIAAASPVAVNLYWLTSNIFSLTQNLVLGYRDRLQLSKSASAA